jgi:UDP-2,4-diacetamido-2,4,6-trideoxy-beta-L-altropyranose hydrolase
MMGPAMVFRVDGGSIFSVAMGHVYRCLKIANHLRERYGVRPVFLMRDFPEGQLKVREQGFPVASLAAMIDVEDDVRETASLAAGALLFIDVRHFEPEHIEGCRRRAEKVVLFDDLGGRDFRPDILVNPAVLPRHRQYPGRYDGVRYCLGLKYFILGKQSVSPRDQVPVKVEKILVSLGGADPSDYSQALLTRLISLKGRFTFRFVLGPAYRKDWEFRQLARESGIADDLEILENVSDLPAEMARADLAVVAGGDTCLELAWVGTPGMIVPTISYEAETAAYLQGQEVFVSLGDIKEATGAVTAAKLLDFAEDYSKRRIYAANGRKLVDGLGLERLMAVLSLPW